jgi:hypothetical protein
MKEKMPSRAMKKRALELLHAKHFEIAVKEFQHFPARQIVNPLFSFLYSWDPPYLKWHAVSAMGEVVSHLADENMESARVIMRRLMWNLNEESGGIGWGSPEAMGEIMARHDGLAREYHCILLSYLREEKGNFLENELLQRGVLWGLGRLAHVRPELLAGCSNALIPFLTSQDPCLRAFAVWAAGPLNNSETRPLIRNLTGDDTPVPIYLPFDLVTRRIGELAVDALAIG